ncbi:MAG: hypothetical protein ABIW82_09050 [Dokdonella sp.]
MMSFTLRELARAVDAIEEAVQALHSRLHPPAFVHLKGHTPAFRHDQRDYILMSHLKCVRSVSLLHAGIALLANGFYQEVGILCRCLSESFEDVLFLATPLGEDGKPSKAQMQLVEEFFQEEFEDPSKPVGTQQKRQRVPRDQVLAGMARIDGNPLNASDGKELTRMLHMGKSGYVHGAYPHIMELFSASPDKNGEPDVANGRFAMSGRMPGQRTSEMLDALASAGHNTAIATCVGAKRLGDKAVEEKLGVIITALAAATASDQIGNPNDAIKKLKRGESLG